MKPTSRQILGIFPSLGCFDGIGRSGLAAWSGICALPNVAPLLLTYGKVPPPAGLGGKTLHAYSRAGAVINALRASGSPVLTLLWHVHLLRLLPILRGTARGNTGRVVLYLHGIEVWQRLPAALIKQMSRVHLVLSNSDYTWSRFLESNPEFSSVPHTTVALGLDSPVGSPVPFPADPPSALMIGRIARTEAYKGHEAVIAAWPEVRRRIPGAEMHVIGPGDLYDELRTLSIRYGVADACHLHGPVSQERKEALLLNSRCMALPSRNEGFGLAYIESMRLGRPCLVSNLDAGREVIHPPEAGLAADPGDSEGLINALCRLLTVDSQWETWSTRSRARYEAMYTESAFVARLNEALGLT